MKKLIRIIVSPIVAVFFISCYWLAGPIGIIMIIIGIIEWMCGNEERSEGIELGGWLLLLPLIGIYNWIQHPELIMD